MFEGDEYRYVRKIKNLEKKVDCTYIRSEASLIAASMRW